MRWIQIFKIVSEGRPHLIVEFHKTYVDILGSLSDFKFKAVDLEIVT